MNAPTGSPVTDDDLMAWVDDRLPAARRAEIDAWLAEHPAEAERVAGYRALNAALRSRFDPIIDAPLPDGLRALSTQGAQPMTPAATENRTKNAHRPWPAWQQLAAGVLVALLGGAGGWLARDVQGDAQRNGNALALPTLPHQAAVAHAVYSPDVRRPVEVTGDQEDALVKWLSKRLGTAVRPPKLGGIGYELVGGRLLPGNAGPVAQFMYQAADGQRLTLYVSTEVAGPVSSKVSSETDTGFRFAREGEVNVFYWVDGRFGYALSAGIAKGELARVATAVYDQLDRKAAPGLPASAAP